MSNRVIVTGCNGYIGSSVIKSLAERGHFNKIIGVDEKENNLEYINDYLHQFHLTDYSNSPIQYGDVVIHLAAYNCVPKSERNPYRYYDNNLIKFSKFIRQNSVITKNLIYSSTSSEFTGRYTYSVSKLAAEHIIRQFCDNYTIFRFFNVFGKDGDHKCFNEESLMRKLMESKETGTFTIYGSDYPTSDGTCVREYTHVKDIADSIALAAELPPANTEFECLAYGTGYTVKEIVSEFEKVNNIELDIETGERRKGDTPKNESPHQWEHMVQNHTLKDIVKI